MGPPPAYIFLTRHGTRLDATDKKWHLTSPTPYDPPLTYGGWQQAKAVGVRIADILTQSSSDKSPSPSPHRDSSPLPRQHSPFSDDTRNSSGTKDDVATRQQARSFRIVIHSSPYLRCVQTSIGICAGLTQSTPAGGRPPLVMLPVRGRNKLNRALLRLDSFLGEWLTPDYFEFITPPPAGGVILEKAKTDLLRRNTYDSNSRPILSRPRNSRAFSTSSPLWSATMSTSLPSTLARGGLDNLHDMNQALSLEETEPEYDDPDSFYIPPTPLYASTPNGKIPEGLVDHAKDACVGVDYQWDSSREPLAFGDSGMFGEEWAAMHRRFRKGLQALVEWYASTPEAAEPFSISTSLVTSKVCTHRDAPSADLGSLNAEDLSESDSECDVETVVVIVSHGAGCNAIIGAMTNQPALIDVSTASLTMAIRRPTTPFGFKGLPDAGNLEGAFATATKPKLPLHQLYDVKLLANTDHLRPAGALPLPANSHLASNKGTTWEVPSGDRSRNSSVGSPAPVIGSFRFGELASSLNGTPKHSISVAFPPLSSAPAPGLGGYRRPSVGSNGLRASTFSVTGVPTASNNSTTSIAGYSPAPPKAPSLWSPAMASSLRLAEEDLEEDPNDIFPDFDHKKKFSEHPLDAAHLLQTAAGSDLQRQEDPFDSDTQLLLASTDERHSHQRELRATGRSAPIHIRQTPSESPSAQSSSTSSQVGGGGYGAGGLWGSLPSQHGFGKRRWTVNDRA